LCLGLDVPAGRQRGTIAPLHLTYLAPLAPLQGLCADPQTVCSVCRLSSGLGSSVLTVLADLSVFRLNQGFLGVVYSLFERSALTKRRTSVRKAAIGLERALLCQNSPASDLQHPRRYYTAAAVH